MLFNVAATSVLIAIQAALQPCNGNTFLSFFQVPFLSLDFSTIRGYFVDLKIKFMLLDMEMKLHSALFQVLAILSKINNEQNLFMGLHSSSE